MNRNLKSILVFLIFICSPAFAGETPESVFSDLKLCAGNFSGKDADLKKTLVCSDKNFSQDVGIVERQTYLDIFFRTQLTFLKNCPAAEIKRALARGDGNDIFRCLDFKSGDGSKGVYLALFVKSKGNGLRLKALYER